MLPLLRPTALRRLLPPQAGALANARDAVRLSGVAAVERHDLSLVQARALGTASWQPLRRSPGSGAHGHGLQLTADDADLVARLAAYCTEGLADGQVCVVAATPTHRAGLRRRLDLAGLTDAARHLLVDVDAAAELATVLREGRPDADLFERHVGARLRARVRSGQQVRVAGEVAGLLVQRGDLGSALELEQLWDGLQRELGFPLLCAYPPGVDGRFRDQVLAEHSHLVAAVGS